MAVILFIAMLTIGCSRSPASAHSTKPLPVKIDPNKPEDTLFEQIRAGFFQIGGVGETLESAIAKVRKVDPGKDAEFKGSLVDLIDSLDAAGASLADYAEDPPSKAMIAKRFAEFDEKRIKAIDASNDALHDLVDARGLADDLAQKHKAGELADAADLLDVAADDLTEAIKALGGKVEQ